jgi:hypothetical protein
MIEPAPYVKEYQIYRMTPKNIPRNLVRLPIPLRFETRTDVVLLPIGTHKKSPNKILCVITYCNIKQQDRQCVRPDILTNGIGLVSVPET